MNGPALNAAMAVLIFQALCAFVVMRALRDRDDLGRTARLIPPALAFLLPLAGPLLAGRLVGAGLRPALVSTAGLAVGMGLLTMTGPVPQPSGTPLGGQPAPKTDQAKTEPAPADTPQPAPSPQPAPTKPATAAAQPAAEPQPVAEPQPADKPQPAEKPQPVAEPQPVQPGSQPIKPGGTAGRLMRTEGSLAPATAEPGMAAQHRMTVTRGPGATYETQLASGPYRGGWLTFAAAITAPPGSGTAVRHFYLGGFVRNYDLLTVDRFEPLPVPEAKLKPGQTLNLATRRGAYRASVRVDRVTRDDQGNVQAVDLLVTLK